MQTSHNASAGTRIAVCYIYIACIIWCLYAYVFDDSVRVHRKKIAGTSCNQKVTNLVRDGMLFVGKYF